MENHQRKTEYVEFWSLYERLNTLTEWGLLQSEYGCGKEVAAIREQMDRALTEAEKAMQVLTPDPVLKAQEPDEYEAIPGALSRRQYAGPENPGSGRAYERSSVGPFCRLYPGCAGRGLGH